MQEDYKIKLKWNVYNNKLKQINSFQYNCLNYQFNINDIKLQKKFVDFICEKDNNVIPIKLCNFFNKNNVKFRLKYKYNKKIPLKTNILSYIYIRYFNLIILKYKLKNIKIVINFNKKNINNKLRRNFEFVIYDFFNKYIYCFQADSNIWIKPKVIKKINSIQIGWLFCQFIKLKITGDK